MLYIKNAALCFSSEIEDSSGLLVEDRKINKIVRSDRYKPPAGADTLDLKGYLLAPGFIDVHLQGAGGADCLDGNASAMDIISHALPRSGVTSFLATTVFKKESNQHIGHIAEAMKRPAKANILGIHLEGPFINPHKKGMIKPDGIMKANAGNLGRVFKECRGALRMMTIAPEMPGALALIRRLKGEGVIAAIGHTDASYAAAQLGITAGISHTTHIFNAMRSLHHREPGPLAAVLLDKNVSVQLISDGIHIHPAVIKMVYRLKGVDGITLITDSMASLGLPDGRYVYDGREYESRAGVCTYKDGTLIGTSLPLNKMARRMMEYSGATLLEVLRMITLNPARVLG
ncbi:MAG: N-acetylglucosamine-6-phosphate deacetylase, partial [Candidatus Omnitrophota bacterium]